MSPALDMLLRAVVIGCSGAALTALARKAPKLSTWTQQGRKPLACDVCMALWTTLALVPAAIVVYGWGWDLSLFVAYTVNLWVTGRMKPMPALPPPPPLEDSDERRGHSSSMG